MSDHNLLEADPGTEHRVIRNYDGEIQEATADDDGILRDEQGRSFSAGAYSIFNQDDGE